MPQNIFSKINSDRGRTREKNTYINKKKKKERKGVYYAKIE